MPLADTLLRLAEINAYNPIWSEQIFGETRAALLNMNYPRRAAEWRLDAMRRAFPEAMVVSTEAQPSYGLPDPDDDHVLHVAVVSPAELILTHNLKDFPPEVCDRQGVQAISPDDFLSNQFYRFPVLVSDAITQQARDLRHPAMSAAQLLVALHRDAPNFSRLVAQSLAERGEL